jgi:hypothetical protein
MLAESETAMSLYRKWNSRVAFKMDCLSIRSDQVGEHCFLVGSTTLLNPTGRHRHRHRQLRL